MIIITSQQIYCLEQTIWDWSKTWWDSKQFDIAIFGEWNLYQIGFWSLYQTFKFYTRQCESDCNICTPNFGASNLRLQTLEQAIWDCNVWPKQERWWSWGEGKVTTDGQTWKVQVHTIAETKIQTHHKFQTQFQIEKLRLFNSGWSANTPGPECICTLAGQNKTQIKAQCRLREANTGRSSSDARIVPANQSDTMGVGHLSAGCKVWVQVHANSREDAAEGCGFPSCINSS